MGTSKATMSESDEVQLIPSKPPKNVGNKEHFQRLNFLYQLSVHMNNDKVSRAYTSLFDSISKKTNTKLSPAVKRSYCKKCKRKVDYQDAGSFKMIRSKKGRKNDTFVIRCKCGSQKVFPIGQDRDYKTYNEREGNLLDT